MSTVLEPFVVSFAKAVFAKGTGTLGVKHTSGNAAEETPSAALHAISNPFANTSLAMTMLLCF